MRSNIFAVLTLWGMAAVGAPAATNMATAPTVNLNESPWYTVDVVAKGRLYYNVFYSYDNPAFDSSFLVSPTFKAQTKPRYFTFETEANAGYEKFLGNAINDHFDYGVLGKMLFNEGGRVSGVTMIRQNQWSDPAYNANYGRPLHNKADLTQDLIFKGDGGDQLKVTGSFDYEDIFIKDYTFNPRYLTHYDIDAKAEYDFKFLPETSWFLRGSGGFRQYITRNLDSNLQAKYIYSAGSEQSIKSSSTYFLGEVGLSGRLTEKTSVDCATGFLFRLYPYWDNFLSPVFYLHFVEQVTRRDQLIAGYDYVVEDAYSTNYLLNQEIYIGLARVMGDQLLLLTKITYQYKNYSTPVARNDQRVTGGGIIKYSLNPNIKVTAELKVDLLASDAFNTQGGNATPFYDPPATYKAGSMALGVTADF